jgi:hypothetical protein
MRQIVIILTSLFLTSFTTDDRPKQTEQNFKIEISYIGLPGTERTNYYVDSNKIIVYFSRYDWSTKSHLEYDKLEITKFDRVKILTFLKQTDWASIPTNLVTETIDGYYYSVELEIGDKKFKFNIDNTYHQTFKNLFTLCNEFIPTKKDRQKYSLPYSY